MATNKILLVALGLSLAAVAGETAYLVFSPRQSAETVTVLRPVPSPTPGASFSSAAAGPRQTVDPAVSLAGRNWLTNWMRVAQKGVLYSSVITNQYRGKVTEFDTIGGTLPLSGARYKTKLKITGEKELSNTFHYTDEETKKIKVVKGGGEQTTLSLADLKTGDQISMLEVLNLTKEAETVIEVIIAKL